MFIGRYSERVHCSHIRKTVGIRLANERKSRVLFGLLLFHDYLNFIQGNSVIKLLIINLSDYDFDKQHTRHIVYSNFIE